EELPVSKQPSKPATQPKPSKIENAKPVQKQPETNASAKKPEAQAGEYLLQAGSFSRSSDAESRRAELSMQGLNARIHTEEVKAGVMLSRVDIFRRCYETESHRS